MAKAINKQATKEANVAFEGTLKVGHLVSACWLSHGKPMRGKARLLLIGPQEYRVELEEVVYGHPLGGSFPVGTKLTVPRAKLGLDNGWSPDNRLASGEEG